MKRYPLIFAIFLIVAAGVTAQATDQIMFGSCLVPQRAHPALSVAARAEPDVFVFLGDNVYADSADPAVIRAHYNRLAGSESFASLRASSDLYAVWDDHDYGANDAGRAFVAREESEEIFEDFWNPDEQVSSRPGIYSLVELEAAAGTIDLILLDTRYFRDPLRWVGAGQEVKGPYAPHRDGEADLLGDRQWRWLESVFEREPTFRIIASSIQVLAEHHGWESWANFPHERERLLSLIGSDTVPTVIVSGDRHFSEYSAREVTRADGTEELIYDFTFSGINRVYPDPVPTENEFRVSDYYLESNVGEMLLDWTPNGRLGGLLVRTYDANGGTRLEQRLDFAGNDR
jgi:alkaline phosphatase D